MDSQEARISIPGLIMQLLWIAALVLLLGKSQYALTRAKTELEIVEPVWKTGEATSGRATAEGPITRTRVFFKAQGVLLEYTVNGTAYRCHTRMLSVSILKKEKNSYTTIKWLLIFYIVVSVLSLVTGIASAIGQSAERRKAEAEKQKRAEEALKARKAREAAEQAKRAAERAQKEAAEKAQREAAEKAQREAAEKTGLSEEWGKVLDDAFREAQKQKNPDEGLSEDWKKVLDEASEEVQRQQSGRLYDDIASADRGEETVFGADPFAAGDGETVYDADAPSYEDGETVYDTDAPSYEDGETVYDADAPSYEDGETVYDADAPSYEDGETVYDADAPSYEDGETVYDADVSSAGDDETGSVYRIESDPIIGGMGRVWKVHHKDWDVDLAMKRPRAEYFKSDKQKEDFIGECEAWINLGVHPNIVACYYVREMDGVPTIFSEWMENGSLAERISDKTLYSGSQEAVGERLLDIAIQFAEGLHYAHRSLLVHRDVKPANLLLTNDWDARVARPLIVRRSRRQARS